MLDVDPLERDFNSATVRHGRTWICGMLGACSGRLVLKLDLESVVQRFDQGV
jgi:hypothetical protein